MEETSYHHGHLKQALIEAGIEMINQEGIAQLSLRKLAVKCKVSHAAPYNHFKDKEDLIQSIKLHISSDFSAYLEDIIKKEENNPDILVELGVQYILYFLAHKQYYRFLFSYFNFHVIIEEADIRCDDFTAFALYRETAIMYMKKAGVQHEQYATNILATWAIVEGLTSILVSDHTICKVDTEALVRKVLKEKIRLL